MIKDFIERTWFLMVKRNDFTFHAKEWNDCISSMTDEELGLLCRRMTEYALGSESDDEIQDTAVKYSWMLIRSQMESDFEKEDNISSNKRKAARASAKVRGRKHKDEPEINSDEGDTDSDISEDDISDSADSGSEITKENFAITNNDFAQAENSRKKSVNTKISRKNSAHAENNLQNSVNIEECSADSVHAEIAEIVPVNADFTDIQAACTEFSTDDSVSGSDSLISQTDNDIYNNLNLNNMSDSQSNIPSKYLNTNVNVNLNVAIGVPTLQEVQDYCKLQNLIINPEKFYRYYSDRQWTTGGIPIHNWQLVAIGWNRNEWTPSDDSVVISNEAITNKAKGIPPRCAKAHNFQERDYDFDELQKKLLAIG